MKRFTEACRAAWKTGNWHGALTIAVTLPDVCASLETPAELIGKRYVRWSEQWLQSRFSADGKTFVSADDLYQIRNSLLHGGSAEIDPKRVKVLTRFEFFTNGSHLIWVEGNRYNGVLEQAYLQLRVDKFCDAICEAVDKWDLSVSADAAIQERKQRLLQIRLPGHTIGGITYS